MKIAFHMLPCGLPLAIPFADGGAQSPNLRLRWGGFRPRFIEDAPRREDIAFPPKTIEGNRATFIRGSRAFGFAGTRLRQCEGKAESRRGGLDSVFKLARIDQAAERHRPRGALPVGLSGDPLKELRTITFAIPGFQKATPRRLGESFAKAGIRGQPRKFGGDHTRLAFFQPD